MYLIDDANDGEPGFTALRAHFPQAERLKTYKVGDGFGGTTFVFENDYLFDAAEHIGVDECEDCDRPLNVCECDEFEPALSDYMDALNDNEHFGANSRYRPMSTANRLWFIGSLAVAAWGLIAIVAVGFANLTGWRP